MPFRDPGGGDLASRIEAGIRERIEEALDAACLDTLVRVRQARRLPPPLADSAQDRAEYQSEVRRLLERLDALLSDLVDEDLGRKALRTGRGKEDQDPVGRLMATQIALARALPDYWQRFDVVRLEYAAERTASRGESRGLLRRLFGLG
jgi:hypothetical protein